MDGSLFDHLTRLVGSRRSRRASLALLPALGIARAAGKKKGKKKKKIAICNQGQTLTVKKRGWQGRYPGATQGECSGPVGECAACSADQCFEANHIANSPEPITYDCCPAEKVCISTSALPDQCCYPNETCQPSLIHDFPLSFPETNCCRPCPGAVETGGCCVKQNEECIDGICQNSGTARLPRTRRP